MANIAISPIAGCDEGLKYKTGSGAMVGDNPIVQGRTSQPRITVTTTGTTLTQVKSGATNFQTTFATGLLQFVCDGPIKIYVGPKTAPLDTDAVPFTDGTFQVSCPPGSYVFVADFTL